MSQRNPMNERYTSEDRKGSTRKSAASAKPKTKAAASVTIGTEKKSKQEQKQERKQERQKEREEQRRLDRKYYNPDTKRYKTLRRIWWALLIGAVVVVALLFLTRDIMPTSVGTVLMVLAYGLIIGAFYVDFSQIKKERQAYQERMVVLEAKQKKEEAAAARAARQGQRHGKKGSGKNASRNPKTQAANAAANAAAQDDDARDASSDGKDASTEATEGAPKKKKKKGIGAWLGR